MGRELLPDNADATRSQAPKKYDIFILIVNFQIINRRLVRIRNGHLRIKNMDPGDIGRSCKRRIFR